MLLSYVLRLRSEFLADRRLVGEVENVASGECRAVGSVEEVVSFCVETGAKDLPQAETQA